MKEEKFEWPEYYNTSKPKSIHEKNKRKRNCMRCNKEFMSQGNHNRICYWCKDTDDWRYGNDYSIMIERH